MIDSTIDPLYETAVAHVLESNSASIAGHTTGFIESRPALKAIER